MFVLIMKEKETTREQIMEAAIEVFAEKGFKAATVREICKAAGVGVASINYYFGDKAGLYGTVLEDGMSKGFARYPVLPEEAEDLPVEERLYFFIRNFVFRLLGKSGFFEKQGTGQLMAREIARPSQFAEIVVQQFIRPKIFVLSGIVRELLGPETPLPQVERCALSIASQCLHYGYSKSMIKRVGLSQGHDEATLESLARHITEFSLGGIERIRINLSESLPES